MCGSSFNLLQFLRKVWQKIWMFENWRERKIKKLRDKQTAAAQFWYTRYISPLSMCVPSFNLLGLTVPEKSVTKYFHVWKLERKKQEEIKGWISSSSLIPVHKIHLPTVHKCTNFQSSRPHSSQEKCDNKFQCWKLEWKKNEEIKGWISSSSLIPVYMIHLPSVHMCTKFQSSRPYSAWEMCDKKF